MTTTADERYADELLGARLFDLLDLLYRHRAAGAVRPLPDYLHLFPGDEDAVAREYARFMAGPQTDQALGADPSGRTDEVRSRRRFGHYEILGELGRGGQGRVLLAEDTRLGRRVALKILGGSPGALNPRRLERFRREAEAAARLQHPDICTLFETGILAGRPYLAMACIEGRTLAQHLAEQHGPDRREAQATPGEPSAAAGRHEEPHETSTSQGTGDQLAVVVRPRKRLQWQRTLGFFEAVARALQAAHGAGVIHRDVKPGNIMVKPDGRPVLLDFGLAHLENDEPLTGSREVFGTPEYMAPEQLGGPASAVDARTDVWALGVCLHECLAGRRPFVGETPEGLRSAVQRGDRPSLRAENPHLPPELETVVDTALDPNPRHRYPSAGALADDLARVIAQRPIAARPTPPWLRARRWVERHRLLVGNFAATLLLATAGLWLTHNLLARERLALDRTAALRLASAAAGLVDEDPATALLLAIEASRRAPSELSRSLLYRTLLENRLLTTIEGLGARPAAVAFDPAGTRLALAQDDGGIRLVNLDGGAPVIHLRGHSRPVTSLAFDAAGGRLLSASLDGTARLWDGISGALQTVLEGHRREVKGACFSPSGSQLLTVSLDGTARLWESATGRCLRVLSGHDGAVTIGAFAPDGRTLATGSGNLGVRGNLADARTDNTVRLWDVASGAPLGVVQHDDWVMWVEFDQASERLLSTSRGGQVMVSEARGGQLLLSLPHPGSVPKAHFDPGGQRLSTCFDPVSEATGIFATGAVIWEATTGRPLTILQGHDGRSVTELLWSHDGQLLASSGHDRAVRLWDVTTGEELAAYHGHAEFTFGVTFSPDDSLLASRGIDPWVSVWRTTAWSPLPLLQGHTGPLTDAGFDAAGRRVLTASEDGTARIWSVTDGDCQLVLGPATKALVAARFTADGQSVWTADTAGTVALFDVTTGERRAHSSTLPGPVTQVAILGDALATGDDAGRLIVWNHDGTPRFVVGGHQGAVTSLAVDREGTLLATGDRDRVTRLINADSGEVLWENRYETSHREHREVVAILFHPDCRHLLVGTPSGRTELLRLTDGRRVDVIRGLAPGVLAVAPGGSPLVSGHRYSSRVTIVDIDAGTVSSLREGHRGPITDIALSPDGELALSASTDGTACLWDLGTATRHALLAGHGQALVRVAIDPTGTLLLTASRDGLARLWPVEPLLWAQSHRPRDLRPGELARFGLVDDH